ncbi:hypothetical protein [Oligoflexus tunisiensis]|uniref:hypothetical protein n=1 Tax=Oligoflexus tunisiensis TaxID=708132 RepID=UPI001C401E45|nr:hypothetical protein [Oligoflexus tunisiensis]
MKWIRLFLLLCLHSHADPVLALESSVVSYRIHITVQESDLRYESDARVRMLIADPELKPGACLYIPLEDPAFRRSAELQSLTGHSLRDQASRVDAALQWEKPELLEEVRSGYWRVPKLEQRGLLKLGYTLRIPGWKDRPDRPRILSDFYPRVLPECPELGPEEFPDLPSASRFEVTMQLPDGWSQLNPGHGTDAAIHYQGRDFYVVLHHGGKVHETEIDGLRLRFLAQSEPFLRLQRPVKTILREHYAVIGRWPTEDLLLIESEEYEPISVAGLILINRPQQAIMRTLQEDVLNWKIWQLNKVLAEQWFGYLVRVGRLQDIWLTQSLSESLGLLYLKDSEQYGNLFASDDETEAWFLLNFTQTQDLLAATLSLLQSHNALVDENQKSMDDMLQRPPYAFVRGSQALRVLLKEMGRKEFSRLLREIVGQATERPLTPENVLNLLRSRFPETLAPLLLRYWQSDVWPDARLASVDAAEDGAATAVRVDFSNELAIPVDVVLQTKDGKRVVRHIQPKDVERPIVFPVPYRQVDWVNIDPDRSIFDSDRYNNSSQWTDLNFFPGTARTLADDAYTIVWAPFLQKLPGNELSLQLGWQLFRYVGTGIAGLLVYQPGTGKTGFRLQWDSYKPEHSLKLHLRISQDDDRTLPGERETSLTVSRRPLIKGLPWLDIYTRQRLKQTLGNRDESHLASSLGVVLHGEKRRTCGWRLLADHAISSWVPSGDFSYERSVGLLAAHCEIPSLRWQGQVFTGVSKREGLVPRGGLFQSQDVEEARLRLDHPRLPLAGRLQTWSTDVSTPLRLPLPANFLVLPRRSLFKVFADGGRLMEPDHRVLASGAGLVLPIGGDVVGKQPITFLEFSLLGVLYRKIDNEVDTRPGFLFDFSGQL